MEMTGEVRRVDSLGRITLPRYLLNDLGINIRDYLEILIDGDQIVLRKQKAFCIFCGSTKDVSKIKDKCVCRGCLKALQEK